MVERFSDKILPRDSSQKLSPEEFRAMLAGETRTKFRMIVDPESGKLYRLVQPNPAPQDEATSSLPRPYYVEMELPPGQNYHYRLQAEKKQRYIDAIDPLPKEPLPSSYRIQAFGCNELSCEQIYALSQALGTDSHWWPLEGMACNSEEHLRNTQFLVLYENGSPVGMVAWEDVGTDDKTGKPLVSINMLALLPEARGNGKKLGYRLMHQSLHQILKDAPETEIVLITSEHDRMPNGKATREFYERLGFVLEKTERFNPADLLKEAAEKGDLGNIDLYQMPAYLPDDYTLDPKTKQPLGRFSRETLKANMAEAKAFRQ